MEMVTPGSATPSHRPLYPSQCVLFGIIQGCDYYFEKIIWSLVEVQDPHAQRHSHTMSSVREGGIPQTPHCTPKAQAPVHGWHPGEMPIQQLRRAEKRPKSLVLGNF